MNKAVLSSGAFFLACTLPTVAVFFWILGSQPGSAASSFQAAVSQQGPNLTATQGTGDAR
ncbi:MAG: hypothetical protein ABI740_03610 [Alphaproteobacteria bacterium]